MAIGLLGLLVLVLLLAILFAVPLSSAFLAGLASARDPAHRVTPENPRVFFRRAALRRLRVWSVLWIALLLLITLMGYNMTPDSAGFSPAFKLLGALNALCVVCSLGVLMVGFAILIAPLVGRPAGLTCLMVLGALAAASLLSAVVVFGFPSAWQWIELEGRRGVNAVVNVFPVWLLPLSVLLTVGLWRWARWRGDRWFRFEE